MDDLNQKLAQILNDPESMNRVREMAESILSQKEESKKASKPEPQAKKPEQKPQEKRGKAPAKKRNEERITPTNTDGEKEYVIKADDAKKVR